MEILTLLIRSWDNNNLKPDIGFILICWHVTLGRNISLTAWWLNYLSFLFSRGIFWGEREGIVRAVLGIMKSDFSSACVSCLTDFESFLWLGQAFPPSLNLNTTLTAVRYFSTCRGLKLKKGKIWGFSHRVERWVAELRLNFWDLPSLPFCSDLSDIQLCFCLRKPRCRKSFAPASPLWVFSAYAVRYREEPTAMLEMWTIQNHRDDCSAFENEGRSCWLSSHLNEL